MYGFKVLNACKCSLGTTIHQPGSPNYSENGVVMYNILSRAKSDIHILQTIKHVSSIPNHIEPLIDFTDEAVGKPIKYNHSVSIHLTCKLCSAIIQTQFSTLTGHSQYCERGCVKLTSELREWLNDNDTLPECH